MLGYPLNSEISGFSYLSLGMNIIISIIIIIQYFLQNKINRTMVILILFLLNFGLFFTYYFFVPVVYISIFITIIIIATDPLILRILVSLKRITNRSFLLEKQFRRCLCSLNPKSPNR